MVDKGSTLPPLTQEKRAEALKRATEARTERAVYKRAMKRGEKSLLDALAEPCMARVKVLDLLASLPGVGKARAERAMGEMGISPNRRVQGLGARQREALLGWFA